MSRAARPANDPGDPDDEIIACQRRARGDCGATPRSGAAPAADLTAKEITQQLYQATAESPLDFSGKNLEGLDLAGLAFKKAKLARTDLFGADLTGADLSGADLGGARLDRVTIISARFDGAKLAGVSLLAPDHSSNLDGFRPEEGTELRCERSQWGQDVRPLQRG